MKSIEFSFRKSIRNPIFAKTKGHNYAKNLTDLSENLCLAHLRLLINIYAKYQVIQVETRSSMYKILQKDQPTNIILF